MPAEKPLPARGFSFTAPVAVGHAKLDAEVGHRIVIADDDRMLRDMLTDYLLEQGFETGSAQDSKALIAELEAKPASLVLLDLRLGAEEGLDVLRGLRERSNVPVIIITGSRTEETDRVVGLELGADDYITKPFSLRELLARIRTVLRRAVAPAPDPKSPRPRVEFGGWVLDRHRRRLFNPEGQVLTLTKGEFALLSAFVDAPGRALSREALLRATRVHEDVFDRSVDVQILRLRRKLEADPSVPRLITTERGFGYCLAAKVRYVRS